MRLLDIQLSMPFMLLALTIIGIFGPSLRNIIIVLAITGWVCTRAWSGRRCCPSARREFVAACRSLGGSNLRIIVRHLLPNVLPTVIVISTLEVGRMMLLESALSFLGLGVRPPTPSWGIDAGGRARVPRQRVVAGHVSRVWPSPSPFSP